MHSTLQGLAFVEQLLCRSDPFQVVVREARKGADGRLNNIRRLLGFRPSCTCPSDEGRTISQLACINEFDPPCHNIHPFASILSSNVIRISMGGHMNISTHSNISSLAGHGGCHVMGAENIHPDNTTQSAAAIPITQSHHVTTT